MTLETKQKRGGPYTKKDQITRRNEVYKLHFDDGYPAVKIAEKLGVNRNTINDDLKVLYSENSKDFGIFDIHSSIIKQTMRMESLRSDLIKDLETQENFHERNILQKMIFEIDSKLAHIYIKILTSTNLPKVEANALEDVIEEEIKEIVRSIIGKGKSQYKITITEREILYTIIKNKKLTLIEARKIFNKMLDLGLEICWSKELTFDGTTNYDIEKFAEMRGYISEEELNKIIKYREKLQDDEEKQLKKLQEEEKKKFFEKYGSDKSKWSPELWKKYLQLLEDYS